MTPIPPRSAGCATSQRGRKLEKYFNPQRHIFQGLFALTDTILALAHLPREAWVRFGSSTGSLKPRDRRVGGPRWLGRAAGSDVACFMCCYRPQPERCNIIWLQEEPSKLPSLPRQVRNGGAFTDVGVNGAKAAGTRVAARGRPW